MAQEKTAAPGSAKFALNELPDLINDIAEDRAVVYVGAGISQSASLPSWDELLKSLTEGAQSRLSNKGTLAVEYFKKLVGKSRNLEIGDWLQELYENTFKEKIQEQVTSHRERNRPVPSIIHQNLVRLPFSIAITTNYDLLLEDAYRALGQKKQEELIPLTWERTTDFLKHVRKRQFRIIHAHGDLSNKGSIILSGSDYTKLETAQPNFGEVLKWLFKTKTFLFVGAGLEDPDLIYQLKQAIAEHGKDAVGFHYALLPYDEAPPLRQKILLNTLRIKVIEIGNEEEKKAGGKKWITNPTSRILRDLSGSVARERFELALNGFPTSDDPYFCLRVSLRQLLKSAIELTGSYRGDFCLSLDGLGSHLSGEFRYWISEGPTSLGVEGREVKPKSICGIAFYQATAEYGIYFKNTETKEIAEESNLGHYGEIEYVPGDEHVKSELAIPVEAGRFRMGVLNLESNLVDGYSEEHLKVARRFAEKAGRLYAAAHERNHRGRRLDRKRMAEPQIYTQMLSICEQLRQMAHETTDNVNLGLLVYQADYVEGKLEAQNPKGTILPHTTPGEVPAPEFYFHDRDSKNTALVTRIFHDGHPYAYPNIEKAIKDGKVTQRYPQQLRIKGPVIGFPVLVNGHIAGIVVVWSREGKKHDLDGRDIELFRRASHLMANDYQWKKGQPPPNNFSSVPAEDSTDDFVSVRKVKRIQACILKPQSANRSGQNTNALRAVGTFYADAIGPSLVDFLVSLHEQEKSFAAEMQKLSPSHPRPSNWISPKRCRCWIRVESSPLDTGKPRFLLALQVSVDPDEPWKSLVNEEGKESGELFGIAMQPHVRQKINGAQRAGAPLRNERKSDPEAPPMVTSVGIDRMSWQVKSLLYDNNPHLSFLLSRVSAYPFAFQQRPNVVGSDIMAGVLEKDPELPWFVAPLIVVRPGQWCESGKPVESEGHVSQASEENLVAYLTFDNGRYLKDPAAKRDSSFKKDKIEEIKITEQWASFQNDLLHQLSLFGACLAQKKCFRMLLPP